MTKTLIVDISHHQPSAKIDWAKAAKEVALMIIRVQYGSNTIDREYKKHVANCKKNGIPFAHYAYGRYTSVADAKAEARDFLNRIDKEAKFLVLDVEDDTIKSCGTKNLREASQAFIDACRDAGYKVGHYISHHLYTKYGLDKLQSDFKWIPRYGKNDGTPNQKPAYACDLWQYTEKGRVGWYNSFLDLNKLTGSKSLEWFLGHEGKPPAPVTSEPMWKGLLFKKGQIGLITILKPINLWTDVADKLTEARTLSIGDQCRVYGYREKYGGQYDVGGGHWVTKMPDHIKYETPSKALLEKAKEFYK